MNKTRERAISILEAIQKSYHDEFCERNKNSKFKQNEVNNVDILGQSELIKLVEEYYNKNNLNSKSIDYSIFETIYGTNTIPTTKYQNRELYFTYRNMFEKLMLSKQKLLNLPHIEIPIFGTAQTDVFYAKIMKPHSSDPFILISQGLRIFAYSMCKIIALSFKVVEVEKGMDAVTVRKYIMKNINRRKLKNMFRELFFMRCFQGQCLHLGIDNPSKFYDRLIMCMSRSFNYFALAHEYAHYILGHLDLHIEDRKGWDLEIQADYTAMILTFDVMSSEHSPTYALWGIYIFLKSLEALEMVKNSLFDTNATNKHPPFKLRRITFLNFLAYNNISPQYLDLNAIDYVFRKLNGDFETIVDYFKNQLTSDALRNESKYILRFI